MSKMRSQERAVREREEELAALKASLETGRDGRAAPTEQWVSLFPNHSEAEGSRILVNLRALAHASI